MRKHVLVLPPIAQTVVALGKVYQDAVQEELALIASLTDKRHGTFAFRNLRWCVAAETDALNPLDLCQQPGDVFRDQPCVQTLIEVHMIPTFGNFL